MSRMKYILLLILPLVFLTNIVYNNKTEFEQDPNYMYLFNGLNMTTSPANVATYTQGTTTVEISAVIMRVAYLFRNTGNSFSDDVLINPQLYIKIVVRTFVVLICLILFLTGLFLLKMTGKIIPGLIFQATPAFSGTSTLWVFESYAAEPILLAGVTIFSVLMLWKFYFNKAFGEFTLTLFKRKIEIDKFSFFAGIITGFCLATKINTLPIVLLPFMLIPGWKNKFLFLIFSMIWYIFFILPVIYLYKLTIGYYLMIFLHTGIYGGGSAGIIDPEAVFQNMKIFYSSEKIIFLLLSLSILFLLIQTIRRKFDSTYKLLAILILVELLIVILVLKHFYTYYFIPVLPVLAVNLFIIYRSINCQQILKTLSVILFIFSCLYLNSDFKKREPFLYKNNFPSDGINLFSYQSTSPVYALKIGDDASRNANSQRLKDLYGDYYFYDIWNKIIITWTDTLSLDSLLKTNEKIYLHALDQYMKELPPPFEIEFLDKGTYIIKNPYPRSIKR